MKALVLEAFNTPFTLKDMEKPVAGKGEVLVRIMASGVNPLDVKIKAGEAAHARTSVPAILGIDMAGVVEQVGEDVTAFAPGDEVYGMTGGVGNVQGSLAEYAAVDALLLARKPANLSMREAAAIPLSFITAWEGLVDRARVSPGKTVLVQGGSGGVGHIVVQLAGALGAKVCATDRTGKVEDYVRQYTQGEGFDIVYDTVGGATLDASFRAIKNDSGHVVSILGWGTHNLAPLSFRGGTYSGVFTLLPLLSGEGRAHHGAIMREATALIEARKLIPVLDPHRYTMKTVGEAYEALENRTAKGRIIVEMPLF